MQQIEKLKFNNARPDHKKIWNKMSKIAKVLSFIIILFLVGSIKSCLFPDCHDDITLCKDNTDVIKNFKNIPYAKSMCKKAAIEQAKWGTPQWGDDIFNYYSPGTDFPKSKIVEITDRNAKFSNGFGAMSRVTIDCIYNFNNDKAFVDIR